MHFSENVSKCASRQTHGLYAPGLALLGSPRLASASLALPAPATTAAALRAARPPKAAGLLLRGAGKASEADPRRGKPSKARPGAFHGFFLFCLFGPWALYLAYGLGPPRFFFILVAPVIAIADVECVNDQVVANQDAKAQTRGYYQAPAHPPTTAGARG